MQRRFILVSLIFILALFSMACSIVGLSAPQKASAPAVEQPAATNAPVLPTSTLEAPTAYPSATSTSPAPTISTQAVLVSKEIIKDIPTPPVKITVEYPFMQEPAADQMFNQEINTLVQAQIDDINKNAADVEDWRAKNMPQFFSQLIMKYATALADENFAAVRLEVSPYVAGAAHPNFFYLTVNYDLKRGKLLQLADLFKPGSNYLTIIADYCKTDLKKQGLEMDFSDGLSPTRENFQNWNLTKDGLQILFDPYQVASWAQGPQKVVIPFDQLQDILLPSGPVEVLSHGM
jgi:peptidoglycan-N-acetylglucosamine deacetylase